MVKDGLFNNKLNLDNWIVICQKKKKNQIQTSRHKQE